MSPRSMQREGEREGGTAHRRVSINRSLSATESRALEYSSLVLRRASLAQLFSPSRSRPSPAGGHLSNNDPRPSAPSACGRECARCALHRETEAGERARARRLLASTLAVPECQTVACHGGRGEVTATANPCTGTRVFRDREGTCVAPPRTRISARQLSKLDDRRGKFGLAKEEAQG